MATFDSNTWYTILSKQNNNYVLGTDFYDAGKGAVFTKKFNSTDTSFKWQIYPYNSTYYVFRSARNNGKAYLGAELSTTETTPGNTVTAVFNTTLTDNSIFWEIGTWSNGMYYISNAANGTEWRMAVKANGLMAMKSNITTGASQKSESFMFIANGTINDAKYSGITGLSATATATSTASSLPTSHSKSKGLSTGATAAIGAVIAFALVFAALAFFLLQRKRKGARNYKEVGMETQYQYQPNDMASQSGNETYGEVPEMDGGKYSHTLPPPVELHSRDRFQSQEMPAWHAGGYSPIELSADGHR